LLREKLQTPQEQAAPDFLVDRLLLDVGGYVESYFEHHAKNGLMDHLHEARSRLKAAGFAIPAMEARLRYGWSRELLQDVVQHPPDHRVTASDKIDRWLTHRIFGFLFFFLLMFFVFQSVFTWAGPAMDLIEAGQGLVDAAVESVIPPRSIAQSAGGWCERGGGRRTDLPASDCDFVFLHRRPGRQRLYGPGRVYHGSFDAQFRAKR
ncbi:MAG: hypothetical protein ABIK07_09945, partial [Planctomycetota bacterium]